MKPPVSESTTANSVQRIRQRPSRSASGSWSSTAKLSRNGT
jgi:hypothetical protein